PFLEAQVFLSHEQNDCRLPENLRRNVHMRDREAEDRPGGDAERGGIMAALMTFSAATAPPVRLDRPIAKAISRAMEEAGIRPSQRVRRVGDYELESLLFEGPGYQDWSAHHVSLKREKSRVRIYQIELRASATARETIANAA